MLVVSTNFRGFHPSVRSDDVGGFPTVCLRFPSLALALSPSNQPHRYGNHRLCSCCRVPRSLIACGNINLHGPWAAALHGCVPVTTRCRMDFKCVPPALRPLPPCAHAATLTLSGSQFRICASSFASRVGERGESERRGGAFSSFCFFLFFLFFQ